MRVTSSTYSNALVNHLNNLGWRQSQLQTQLATGRKVQTAQDDPVAMQRVLDLQTEARGVDRYQVNIAVEKEKATAVYTAVKSLKTISDRAGEIAILADGLKSPQELQAYATEIGQMLRQAVQVANTSQNGSYIFGGTKSTGAPFSIAEDASGHITSVSYAGNQSTNQTEIAKGLTTSSQIVGANTDTSGIRGLITDSAAGADFFNHLISLHQHLVSGEVQQIAETDRPLLAKDEENFLYHMSHNGAVQSRLQATSVMLRERSGSLDSQMSATVDVDLAQTLVQLNASQTAYQAALQSSAKLLDISLLTFLR